MSKEKIEALSKELEAAKLAVATANEAVLLDKKTRSTSFISKLVDMFKTTSAEAELNRAEGNLRAVSNKIAHEATEYIRIKAKERIDENESISKARDAHINRLNDLFVRSSKVGGWLRLVEYSKAALDKAARSCASAGSAEVADLVTTSKAISTLSYLGTSDAQRDVNVARDALIKLSEELPAKSADHNISTPDDLPDFAFDIAFGSALDVLSVFSLSRIEKAERACLDASEQINPLLNKLTKLSSSIGQEIKTEIAHLRCIEKPYLDHEFLGLYSGLLQQAPDSIEVFDGKKIANIAGIKPSH